MKMINIEVWPGKNLFTCNIRVIFLPYFRFQCRTNLKRIKSYKINSVLSRNYHFFARLKKADKRRMRSFQERPLYSQQRKMPQRHLKLIWECIIRILIPGGIFLLPSHFVISGVRGRIKFKPEFRSDKHCK